MTIRPALPTGLYVITSTALCETPQRLRDGVRAAIRGGAALVQYRDKTATPTERLRRAQQLQADCAAAGVPLIINDDVALALTVGAAGVHIGRSDGEVADVRARLGDPAWLGVTCGDVLARAAAARRAGADYVAFGRLYPSRTKPDAPPARLSTLTAAGALGCPVCAIGGLRPPHVAEVAAAGAHLFAVVDGVFGAPDIEAAARAYCIELATYNHGSPRV